MFHVKHAARKAAGAASRTRPTKAVGAGLKGERGGCRAGAKPLPGCRAGRAQGRREAAGARPACAP